MNLELKKRIVKCLVWSVAMYAAETWTLRQVDRKKIEAFETWIWRRMEKISWRDKITNDDVLRRVNKERNLPNEIWQRKHRWIGYMLRHDSFLQGIFEGRMLGKRTTCTGECRCFMIWPWTVNTLHSSKQLQKGWCGDTVEGYPERALQQKTEGEAQALKATNEVEASSSREKAVVTMDLQSILLSQKIEASVAYYKMTL